MINALRPYTPHSEDIRLRGEIVFSTHLIHLSFELSDPDSLVCDGLDPGDHSGSFLQRADGLWKTTCFEAFWGEAGHQAYWEFNISGSGHAWNLYRFDSYRSPQPPVASHDFELDLVEISADRLKAQLRANVIMSGVEANLCAVIRTLRATHHYAVNHAPDKPDFHMRDQFRMNKVN